MKKILAVILAGLILQGLIYVNHNYTRTNCVVLQVVDGVATIGDYHGNVWDVLDSDLKVGQMVHLKMHDNYTVDKEDDIIKKVIKKSKTP